MNYLKLNICVFLLFLTMAGCGNNEWTTAEQQKGSNEERAIKNLVAERVREAQKDGLDPDDLHSIYTLDELGAPRFRNIELVHTEDKTENLVCGEIAFGPFDERGTLITNLVVYDDYVNIGPTDARCGSDVDACLELLGEIGETFKGIADSFEESLSPSGTSSLQRDIDTARERLDYAETHCAASEQIMLVVDQHRSMYDSLEDLVEVLHTE